MKDLPSAAAVSVLAAAVLAACASTSPTGPIYSQASLPASLHVPPGNRVAMQTVAVGTITFQCSARKDASGQFEWVSLGPDATLNDHGGRQVGKYYGSPATWESTDGSKLTATQVAVSPNGTTNIPLQLVKGNPASGSGAMTGVTYIQRVGTRGGVAPKLPCTPANAGARQVVKWEADYILYKAM